MKKLDIRKDISSRKFKQTNRFYYWIYKTVMKIISKKYNPHYTIVDDINDCKGPCFVIFNHLSRLDHVYVMEITYPRRVNMLAGYNEFFRSHLHFAFKNNNVLPKKNYTNDIVSTKAMLQIIKQGGAISFAPEGLASNDGMNKPIVPGTGHMLKHFNIPVYFVRLQGQHLQNTKVSLDERYGETYATISLMFSPEDLQKLSVEEIDNKINLAFKNDEYAWQKEHKIKWKTNNMAAENLQDILYKCPKCGHEFEMEGKGNKIICKHCGNGATIDDYYDFHKLDDSCVLPETISEWVRNERIDVIKEIRENPNYSFSDKVKIGRLPNDHYIKDHKTSEIVGEGLLTLDHDGLHYLDYNNKDLNFDLTYKTIYTLITVTDASYFNFYVNGEYTDVFPEKHSFMKFNLLIEEMHRLHVNFYKNLPWNDYMYENIDKKAQN